VFTVENTIDNDAGTLHLVAAVLGDFSESASDILFTLTITAHADGTSSITFTQLDIADAVGFPTPAEGIAGTVIVETNESEASVATQQEVEWCSGVDIVFFAGGSPNDVFAPVVYNGAVQAADDLGADLEVIWSDWEPETMVRQFVEAVAAQPDGIAVMGHPGDDAFETAIDDAVAQGIIVTSQNVPLNRIESKYSDQGFGYVGAELYSAGYSLGVEAVKRSGIAEGDRALVWGLLSQPTRGLRTQGVIDALEDAGLLVDYLEIDAATNASPPAGASIFAAYVAANPDVKLVVTDHGGLTASMEIYFAAAELGPDSIYAAGFDLSATTIEAIRAGWTDLVIDQQQWLQGYLPVLQICLTAKYAFSGLHIDTGLGFAHADNIEWLADLVEGQIR
jgi:simple sugar transport system substrate-binding protein